MKDFENKLASIIERLENSKIQESLFFDSIFPRITQVNNFVDVFKIESAALGKDLINNYLTQLYPLSSKIESFEVIISVRPDLASEYKETKLKFAQVYTALTITLDLVTVIIHDSKQYKDYMASIAEAEANEKAKIDSLLVKSAAPVLYSPLAQDPSIDLVDLFQDAIIVELPRSPSPKLVQV